MTFVLRDIPVLLRGGLWCGVQRDLVKWPSQDDWRTSRWYEQIDGDCGSLPSLSRVELGREQRKTWAAKLAILSRLARQ